MGILGADLCNNLVSSTCPQCIYNLCEPPFLPFIPLNGHLIKDFAILLKTIFLTTPCMFMI